MKLSGTALAASGLLVASASSALAAPAASSSSSASTVNAGGAAASKRSAPIHIPIRKRETVKRSGNELLEWANEQKAILQNKYGLPSADASSKARRAQGTALTNVQYDSTWVATVTGGTPSKDYEVVLDTGSADFWIASEYYQPSSSSTFQNRSTAFNVQYGSGQVAGYEASDTFSLAGTTVQDTRFAVADQVSSGLVSGNMEGIMGMGFQKLAASGEPPLWVAANVDTFSFYLERASLTSNNQEQAGGIFTLGGTNSSLYQGNISYNTLIEELYWMVRLGGIGARGSDVSLDGLTRAAIDTGTTLVGGPNSVVQSFYANIPGSQSQGNGYYSFPCRQTIDATLTFGNQQYTIPDSDFVAGTLDQSGSQCLGAFFGLGSSSQTDLQWIVGDAFLKNVYSVFTTSGSNGAAVGFASLASGLNSGTNSKTVSTSSTGATSAASTTAQRSSMLSLAAMLAAPLIAALAL